MTKKQKTSFQKIGIAADHAGKDLKSEIIAHLRSKGIEVQDYGLATESTERVDYPDYGARLAEDVSKGKLDGGIAVCGSGIGMAIVANKFPGIRAACVWDEFSTRMSRAHNDANILCLGARATSVFRAKDFVDLWLETPFAGEQHEVRVRKIEKLEEKLLNSHR